MSYILQQHDAEMRGKAEGRREGRKEGEEHKAREMAIKMYRRGDSILDIAELIEVSADTVRRWLNGPTGTSMTMQ